MALDAWCRGEPPPELLNAIAQFNAGAFFECHETLEALWRATPEPGRALYQGILQVGVAFHHQRRGNYRGALRLLDAGLARLAPFAPICRGVDIAALLADAQRARAALLALGPARVGALDPALVPQVRLSAGPTGDT